MNDHCVVDPEDEAWMVGMLRGTPAERRGGHRCSEISQGSQGISVGNAQEICFKHIFKQVLLLKRAEGPTSRWRIPVFSLWHTTRGHSCWKQRIASFGSGKPSSRKYHCSCSGKSRNPPTATAAKLPPVSLSFCDSAVAIFGFE